VRTAEEFALHKIIEMAEAFMQDGDEAVEDEIERLQLPRSTLDEDFALVSDAAFQDHDVLMLFDMPHVSQQYNNWIYVAQYHTAAGYTCTHPDAPPLFSGLLQFQSKLCMGLIGRPCT
jgi:hypothetical protein